MGSNAATSNMVSHLGSEDKQQMRSKVYVTGSYSSGEISQRWSQPLPHFYVTAKCYSAGFFLMLVF